MKADPNSKLIEHVQTRQSLANVLVQSQDVTKLIKETAEALAMVNGALKQEIAEQDASPAVAAAFDKNLLVEEKVENASEKLTAMNHALEREIRDRLLLDHQFAAATEQEQAARHASLHDVLTGLPNRELVNDRLEHGIAQAKRHHRSLAVMFLDLDDFKNINDSHGHDVGDAVLKLVAHRLRENSRSDDTVGRVGGDEFVYLLTEVRDEQAVGEIAEKMIKAIQAPMSINVGTLGVELIIKVSIGIAISPMVGASADALIAEADFAMYEAKRSKSGHSFAEVGSFSTMFDSAQCVSQLRSTISRCFTNS
ncbi:MAG: GGDEF domain-containing protein [Casimicrobiaceae bacterium]